MIETRVGAAALYCESVGCDVLTALCKAEDLLAGGEWIPDHVVSDHRHRAMLPRVAAPFRTYG